MNKESAKKLKEYLKNPRWLRILVPVFLALAVIGIIAGITLDGKKPDPSKAIEFYPADDEMKGKYVYLDVKGISDYVASRDSERWYVAVDPYGYGYIVKLNISQFYDLKEHNTWWYAEEEYDLAPTRIYGMPDKISDELADVIKDVFEYSSRDEVYDVFGKYLLNSMRTPSKNVGAIFLMIGLLSAVTFLVLWLSAAIHNGSVRRSLKNLDKQGLLDEAAVQLDSPLNEIIGEDVTRISQDFIFCPSAGNILPLKDIIWMYGHVQRYNGAVTSQTLQAATNKNRNYSVCEIKRKNGVDQDTFIHIMEVLQERNPDLILGYSLENLRAYGDICKEEKARAKAQD